MINGSNLTATDNPSLANCLPACQVSACEEPPTRVPKNPVHTRIERPLRDGASRQSQPRESQQSSARQENHHRPDSFSHGAHNTCFASPGKSPATHRRPPQLEGVKKTASHREHVSRENFLTASHRSSRLQQQHREQQSTPNCDCALV